jgi:hypothetical protein
VLLADQASFVPRRPLFQGSHRRVREKEFSVVMVISWESDPFLLSAEPLSIGWDRLSQKGRFAP